VKVALRSVYLGLVIYSKLSFAISYYFLPDHLIPLLMYVSWGVVVRADLISVLSVKGQWRTQDFWWVGGLRQEFFSVGVQQIQLRTKGTEKRDLGAVAP
jgi:hypothetical protein